MKAVILGSGGFIGSNLSRFLKKKGIEIHSFSSSDREGINPDTGLISDHFSIPKATSTVVYLATSPFYRKVPGRLSHILNVNLISAVKVAEISRQAKVERYIYASTGNVYAPSFTPLDEGSPLRRDNWYSLSKIQSEEALALFRKDMEIIVVRPFGVYGPGQTNRLVPNLLKTLLTEKEIYLEKNPDDPSDLDGLRISLCYIDDAVEMLYKLMIGGGPAYLNIAGDKAVSIRKIATLLGKYVKKKVRFEISEKCRHFDCIADISLLKRTLQPKFTALNDGLQEMVDRANDRKP
jgi:nucleoside-diphosphate-sugar epimerase